MRERMKYLIIAISLVALFSCEQNKKISSTNPVNWEARTINLPKEDSLHHGTTYLPVYSEVYQSNENKTYPLTVTVSIRNMNPQDTIYILNARYFNSAGHQIRSYFDKPIYLAPLETIDIVIDEGDKEGGTGANFIFDWAIENNDIEPLFEAVMISTTGQQGLSFITKGIKISK